MRRRTILGSMGALALSSGPVCAQQPNLPVIAVLGSGAENAVASREQTRLLQAGLSEMGMNEGRDYRLESRWADSDYRRFPQLAAELLARRPNAVVVSTIPAA